MIEINPILLQGNWDLGYALDTHIINSVPIGEDAFGHIRFDNTRSPIGELLYRFKYRYQYHVLPEIVDVICDFLNEHPEMKQIETIIPVPPTKSREYQPTIEIAEEVARRLGVHCCPNVLENTSDIESKSLSSMDKHLLNGHIIKRFNSTRKHNTLLLDDLYKSGTTLKLCTALLREDPLVDKIFVLSITKTKNS